MMVSTIMSTPKTHGRHGIYSVSFGRKNQIILLQCTSGLKKIFTMIKPNEIVEVTKQLGRKSYWNKTNTIEFWAFSTKLAIIFPGLLFGVQVWWLYLFALLSSIALILTSTVKTLPTIIYFNVGWSILATAAIAKHFIG